jgi:predicted RNA binding protein YcfA (HicA-like mRNA interferase family)
MSKRLPRITGDEALKALQRDGWFVLRIKGSHHLLAHATKAGRPNIPIRGRQMLDPGTMASIIKAAGLTVEQFRDLL